MKNYAARITNNSLVREDKEKLSRRQKSIVKSAIEALPKEDRCNKTAIVAKVSEMLEDLYDKRKTSAFCDEENESTNMDNQLKRMGIQTVTDIGRKVDSYFLSHVKLSDK